MQRYWKRGSNEGKAGVYKQICKMTPGRAGSGECLVNDVRRSIESTCRDVEAPRIILAQWAFLLDAVEAPVWSSTWRRWF